MRAKNEAAMLGTSAISAINTNQVSQLFENLSELLTPDMTAAAVHTTRGTVYQWHARPSRYHVPDGLFVKLGRKLLIRRDILRTWVLSTNKGVTHEL